MESDPKLNRVAPPRLIGLVAMLVSIIGQAAIADEDATSAAAPESPIAEYRSQHFLVHTDVLAEEVEAIIQRMEAAVDTAQKFWGRPYGDRIPCYIVGDLANWPADAFSNQDVRSLIQYVGGGTDVKTITDKRRRVRFKPRIYATNQKGIAEHEAVHAYCIAAFGATGPEWFREGMAELASYGADDARIRCSTEAFKVLAGPPRTLAEITRGDTFAKSLTDSLTRETDRQTIQGAALHAWDAADDRAVASARASNYWSWALCHLLYHSPNYRQRFRLYGRSQLANNDAQFKKAFEPVTPHIAFELRHFLQHAAIGYRVDFCHWDWTKRAKPLMPGESTRVIVKARRGFQATGLELSKGAEYHWESTGQWRIDANTMVCAGDCANKNDIGAIQAVSMKNFEMSATWTLNHQPTFVAQRGGALHLRCNEDWTKLADNVGQVTIRLSRVR